MILLNFGHPLTSEQLATVQTTTGQATIDVREIKTQFDHEQSFVVQVSELVASLNLDANTWQTESILINPPTHNLIAISLLAELHGRMGYFPAVMRLKPVVGSIPPRFALAEIVNLQAIRDVARTHR
jgi:hypothetical protein